MVVIRFLLLNSGGGRRRRSSSWNAGTISVSSSCATTYPRHRYCTRSFVTIYCIAFINFRNNSTINVWYLLFTISRRNRATPTICCCCWSTPYIGCCIKFKGMKLQFPPPGGIITCCMTREGGASSSLPLFSSSIDNRYSSIGCYDFGCWLSANTMWLLLRMIRVTI